MRKMFWLLAAEALILLSLVSSLVHQVTAAEIAAAPTATITPTSEYSPSATLKSVKRTKTPTALPIPTSTAPAQAIISNIITGLAQKYSLSCEARASVDFARYLGVELTEDQFLAVLPFSSDDPDAGFVGDLNGDWGHIPPRSYGVHAGPVAEALTRLDLLADARHNMSWSDAQIEVANGRPVIVWVIGHVWDVAEVTPVTYTSLIGRNVLVAPFEHAVLLIGYSSHTAIILDGANRREVSLNSFLQNWGVLGRMAVSQTP